MTAITKARNLLRERESCAKRRGTSSSSNSSDNEQKAPDTTSKPHHEVLDLPADADCRKIKKAYYALAKVKAVDKGGSEKEVLIHTAYIHNKQYTYTVYMGFFCMNVAR
jgi:hypothetical protein